MADCSGSQQLIHSTFSRKLWDKQFFKFAAVTRKNIKVNRGFYTVNSPAFTVLPESPFMIDAWLYRLQIMCNPNWIIIKIALQIEVVKINIGINYWLHSIIFFYNIQPFHYFLFYFV